MDGARGPRDGRHCRSDLRRFDGGLSARRALACRRRARLSGPYRRERRDQCLCRCRFRARLGGGRGIGSALAGGQPTRSDRRRAGHDQGQYLGQGTAHPARLDHDRHRAGASRLAGGGAPARAGRRHSRQDLHARAWLDRRLPQPAHGHYAQSVESRTHARRLDRRRGGGRVAGSGRAASRHRWRRLAAHSGGLHRRVRHEAELRPGRRSIRR